MLPELRHRIFRLIEERQRRTSEMPTCGQIAQALGEPLRNIVVTLTASEAMGMVWIPRGLSESEDEWPVMLKPSAYIYLEAQLAKE